ncbi:hypothetical protein [Knoellia koreensis]|uniref:Uncharacterized protein n=1 Tax=Knoellia koreensis TaxID=2730921 RepID=A0A849HEU4_9MICO|nr:hypothetical protein [Knoellia sp. DB2414S]NNM45134.1 hypothetical protein [Knoellia sp. DB2414S]
MTRPAFTRVVTIHFGPGDVTRMTVDEAASRCGLTVPELLDSTRQLVESGFLTPRPDGSYDATFPHPGAAS